MKRVRCGGREGGRKREERKREERKREERRADLEEMDLKQLRGQQDISTLMADVGVLGAVVRVVAAAGYPLQLPVV